MDILHYLDEIAIDYKGPNKRGFVTLSECPFCGKTNKMDISVEENEWGIGYFQCYSCRSKSSNTRKFHRFSAFIAKVEKLDQHIAHNKYFSNSTKTARKTELLQLNIVNNVENPNKTLMETIENWKKIDLPKNSRLITNQDKEHLKYLESRGVNLELALKTKIHIIPEKTGDYQNDRFYNRVIFPLLIGGQSYGYIARDITGTSKLKVLNSSGPLTSEYLWNFDNVKNSSEIVIVEGNFDAFTCGIDRTMASLGKNFESTQGRILLLKAISPEKLTIYFDNGAWSDSMKAARILSEVLHETQIYIASNRPETDIPYSIIENQRFALLGINYQREDEKIYIRPVELKILKDSCKYYLKFLTGESVRSIYSKLEYFQFYKEDNRRLDKIKRYIRIIHENNFKEEELVIIGKSDYLDANDRTKEEVNEILNNASIFIPNLNNPSI